MASRKSPYLENRDRLVDVIAAIQAMGAHPRARLDLDEWAKAAEGAEKCGELGKGIC
jgi:hypothetical protein